MVHLTTYGTFYGVTSLGVYTRVHAQKSFLRSTWWPKWERKTALEGPPCRHTPLVGDTVNLPVKNRGHPLFAPFLTLFGKKGVNKGALRGFTVGDHMPYLCPQSHSYALPRHNFAHPSPI